MIIALRERNEELTCTLNKCKENIGISIEKNFSFEIMLDFLWEIVDFESENLIIELEERRKSYGGIDKTLFQGEGIIEGILTFGSQTKRLKVKQIILLKSDLIKFL